MGTRKDARGAGREPSRGQAGKRVHHLPFPRPGPSPPTPTPHSPSHPLPGAPSTSARLGATGREQLRAAPPPPSLGACSHSPRVSPSARGPAGFLRQGAAGRERGERARNKGGDSPGSTRGSGRRARGSRPSLCSPVAPTRSRRATSARGRRAGTPGGRSRNGSSVGERSQVALGSSSLGKEVESGPSTQAHSLKERH